MQKNSKFIYKWESNIRGNKNRTIPSPKKNFEHIQNYKGYHCVISANSNEIDRKQNTNFFPPKNEKVFRDVLLLWKETNHLKHKGATEIKYEHLIEHHILPALGNLPLSSITTLKLNEFAKQKLDNGRLDKKGGLSPSYVRSIMIIVSSAMQYAIDEGMCPNSKIEAYKPPIENKEFRILTISELELLECFLLKDMDETKLGIYLSLNCGLRIGEICALRWSDIDLEKKVIHIRSTVARVKDALTGRNCLVIDKPKTKASLRDVPIHSKLMSIINEIKEKSNSMYVVSRSTTFVSPRTYEYRYHRILDKCGLDPYNYHALRHTFATRCIIAGVDVKTLSEILGHSNTSITLNTYVHPSMEMKLHQIEKINTCSH